MNVGDVSVFVMCGTGLAGLLVALMLFDAWYNLRTCARAAKALEIRTRRLETLLAAELDLDAIEAVLYLRGIYARGEGVEPDIAAALEALVARRRGRK